MIRKFTVNLFLACALFFCLVRCDDEVSQPPKSTLSVDKTSGLVEDTEFTFTVTQVSANSISLLPYGLPGGDAGILVTSFANGVAQVKFKYSKPGTFQAIVVTNNHSDDGESSNTQSDPIQIVISSDDNSITEFKFDKVSTKTELDKDAQTIKVTVPYGTDITKLKATFSASGFTTVSVGGNTQTSGTTENNFSSPLTYRVTANDGKTRDYVVSVTVTPIETKNTITSATAKATSKATKDKPLPVYIDNTARNLVVYDTLGAPSTNFDSVRIGYKLDGAFSYLKFGGKKLKQDSLFNLIMAPVEQFVVTPQDSLVTGEAIYTVYALAAPKLLLEFNELVPAPVGITKPTNFNYDIRVLSGTDVTQISTRASFVAAANHIVTDIKVVEGPQLGILGVAADVNYIIPVKIELTVTDTTVGITYKVVYTVSVTVVQ